jgi:hypothetical protein
MEIIEIHLRQSGIYTLVYDTNNRTLPTEVGLIEHHAVWRRGSGG